MRAAALGTYHSVNAIIALTLCYLPLRRPLHITVSKPAPTSQKSPESLRTIEALLLWEGGAGNERVRELLGLHFTSASRLLAQYAALNPTGLTYSTSQRRWIADADFKPCLTGGSIDEYLALTLPTQRAEGSCVVRTHLALGTVSPRVFAILHRAIRDGVGVAAKHCSMRDPTPRAKTFFPHALVEAGRRWHVRAFVSDVGAFQDLALTRLSHVELTDLPQPDAASPGRDAAWTTLVDVRLVPHPELTAEQKQMVRAEYFGRSTARVETVRAALAPYVIHDLRAATDLTRQQPPEFQLYVSNIEHLGKCLMPV